MSGPPGTVGQCMSADEARDVYSLLLATSSLSIAACICFAVVLARDQRHLLRVVVCRVLCCRYSSLGASATTTENYALSRNKFVVDEESLLDHAVEDDGSGRLVVGPHLKLFVCLVTVDFLQAAKHVADGIVALTAANVAVSQPSGSTACVALGSAETLLTLLRALLGTVYWLHVAALVWGLPLLTGGRAAFTVAAAAVLCAAGMTAFVASQGLIGLRTEASWCWVRDEIHLRLAFGDVWFGLQIACGAFAVAAPLLLPALRRDHGESVVMPLLLRTLICVPYAVALVSWAAIEDSPHGTCERRAMQAWAAAAVVPLRGLADVVVFFVSEPGLFSDRWRHVGFTRAIEFIRARADLSAPRNRDPVATYGSLGGHTTPGRGGMSHHGNSEARVAAAASPVSTTDERADAAFAAWQETNSARVAQSQPNSARSTGSRQRPPATSGAHVTPRN